MVGDLLFEPPLYNENLDDYLDYYYNTFLNDDLTIANMEVVIGNDSLKNNNDEYNFCAPKSIGNFVIKSGFDILSTANNHTYDKYINGLNSTLSFFKDNSTILTVGTYKDNKERNEIHYKVVNGIKIAFLAYTYGTNIKVSNEYRNLIGLFKNPDTKEFDENYKNIITNEITNAKKNSDILIVMMHWGKEFTHEANEEQKSIANFLNNLGVDIIYGSHSHSIQPIEWINNKYKTLVYYSFGNFISADEDISRVGEKFDNDYQYGLISKIKIKKENNDIIISDVKTNIAVNYYDKNMKNFKLIPLNEYKKYEKTHYRYKNGLNYNYILKTYNEVIDKQFQ